MFYLNSMFTLSSRFKQPLDFILVNIFISIAHFSFKKNKNKTKLKQHKCIDFFSI